MHCVVLICSGSSAATISRGRSASGAAHRQIPFDRIAFFFGGLAKLSAQYSPGSRPVVVAAGVLVVEWLLLLYLYRRRIFLRV